MLLSGKCESEVESPDLVLDQGLGLQAVRFHLEANALWRPGLEGLVLMPNRDLISKFYKFVTKIVKTLRERVRIPKVQASFVLRYQVSGI